jgi:transposase
VLLNDLRTPEGDPIPPNTLDEIKRDMERRQLICEQIRRIEQERVERLEQAPNTGPNAMVHLLARVTGIGIETADTLVREVLTRNLRDRRAVARYGGLTGAPNQSGSFNREKGLARSGNPRVRRCMIGLAWRFVRLQKDSPLVKWVRAAHGQCQGLTQNHDRGARPQAADCLVGAGARGRGAGGYRHASGVIETPRAGREIPRDPMHINRQEI